MLAECPKEGLLAGDAPAWPRTLALPLVLPFLELRFRCAPGCWGTGLMKNWGGYLAVSAAPTPQECLPAAEAMQKSLKPGRTGRGPHRALLLWEWFLIFFFPFFPSLPSSLLCLFPFFFPFKDKSVQSYNCFVCFSSLCDPQAEGRDIHYPLTSKGGD